MTSYKQQKPDNFLIQAKNGRVVSSLRFNYMFPVPKALISERKIASEPDPAYRALLAQELRFCIKNQDTIRNLAERTYRRVLLGKDPGLIANSCDFRLLEEHCLSYAKAENTLSEKKPSLDTLVANADAKKVPPTSSPAPSGKNGPQL